MQGGDLLNEELITNGPTSSSTSTLPSLMPKPARSKHDCASNWHETLGAGVETRACLACTRPWIGSPAPQKASKQKY